MRNPYGLNADNVLVTVDEVERGLECHCICPACCSRLQAHKGISKRAYFSHYRGSDCGHAYETALHMLAKEIIQDEGLLLLPELIAESDRSIGVVGSYLETRVIVPPWRRQTFDAVTLEKGEGSFTPDVSLVAGNRRLFVEIYVTHKVDENKLGKIKKRGIGTIEYDFRKCTRVLTRADLKRVLIETYVKTGHGRGTWIYHPNLSAVETELTALYRERNASRLKSVDRSAVAGADEYARVKGGRTY